MECNVILYNILYNVILYYIYTYQKENEPPPQQLTRISQAARVA